MYQPDAVATFTAVSDLKMTASLSNKEKSNVCI